MSESRVMFFYQHFWPDSPPYASMLRLLASTLSDTGKIVDMLTAQPSYKAADISQKCLKHENVDGINVYRMSGLPFARQFRFIRLLNKVLFPFIGLVHIALRKLHSEAPDVIVAATIPPVLNGFCALMAARICGAQFIYHLQDIYPEIGVVGDLWSKNSLRYRILLAFDTFTTRKADICVVLSDDMRDSLLSRGVSSKNIRVINNFMLPAFETDQMAQPANSWTLTVAQSIDVKHVVFAGNIGRFQALDVLVKAFLDPECHDLGLVLHFIGDGVVKNDLELLAGGCNRIFFHDHMPFKQAALNIAQCHAGIVSVSEGVCHFAYPSKTLTYLGLGVPVLAIVEGDTALANEISGNNLGVVAPGFSKADIVIAFKTLSHWLDSHPNVKQDVASFAVMNVSFNAAMGKWNILLDSLSE